MTHLGKTFLLSLATAAALAACGGPATPPPETPTDGQDAVDAASVSAPDGSAAPDAPPEGGGTAADVVASKCVACHESPEIGKLTVDEFNANLDANHETVELTDEERQSIVDYLAKP